MAILADVISSSFCVPHESQFVVEHKLGCGPDRYQITVADEERNLLFTEKPESGFLSPRKRRIYDAASGEVLVAIRHKTPLFGKSSWVAFQGDSENESQVLFTLRRKRSGSWRSCGVLFEVFLPENNDSSNPDFSMKAKSWRSMYSVLSNGTPIAEDCQQLTDVGNGDIKSRSMKLRSPEKKQDLIRKKLQH